MIKNMKIRKSLVMGYGITIVVSAIIIIVSLVLMRSVYRYFGPVCQVHPAGVRVPH